MKQTHILKLFTKESPDIEKDILIAKKLVTDDKIEHAAEKYRDVGKKLLSLKLFSFAIEYYTLASNFFIKCQNYAKAINTEVSIYNIHRLTNNTIELASTHEKIASFYRHFVKDFKLAGRYYLSAAKQYEEIQNYRSAFKKALFASECFEQTNETGKKIDSHSFAFRMALQSGYFEKAGEHSLKWIQYIPKDYSPHYISVCVKGFKTFQQTDRHSDALMFLREIIHAHYVANVKQIKIRKYLKDEQKLSLLVNKSIDVQCNSRLLALFGADLLSAIDYSIELRQISDSLGLTDGADFFYLQQKELERNLYFNNKEYSKYLTYSFWKITCLYGTSLSRWFMLSIFIVGIFGASYSNYHCPAFLPTIVQDFLVAMRPEIKIATLDNFFSPYYYSIVAFTTLGYGDITPGNLSAQVFFVVEVFTGYLMLGCLLTVFSKKILR
jgi:hypothetical protein